MSSAAMPGPASSNRAAPASAMLCVEDAQRRILAALRPTPAEIVPLAEAWNRVTATAVLARLTQPPEDVSAMDAYALRGADGTLGATLSVIGSAPAGHPFDGSGSPGQTALNFSEHSRSRKREYGHLHRIPVLERDVQVVGVGYEWGGVPLSITLHPPVLGGHTEQVLRAVGLSAVEIVDCGPMGQCDHG